MKVVHLTSAHPRFDTRIFLKQCRSLGARGYGTTLIVADGKGDEIRDGVEIIDVGKPTGRLDRMLGASRRVIRRAAELDADLYHLHDPELLPGGLWLKRRGKRIVFDSHEDVPQQMLSKPYLRPIARKSISFGVAKFERYACRKLDGVIAATPFIRDKFLAMGINAVDVNNFPMLGELQMPTTWGERQREVCYVGGLEATRGCREMVLASALTRCRARLNLGGYFSSSAFEREVKQLEGWGRINELGYLDRDGVRKVLARSLAGLVTLHPTRNYLDALPVKMFEYMSAGLPVIASNFPLWREIIEGNECGICADPLDPASIARAIDHLVENPDKARQMGENGRRAVDEKYNWAFEEKKLFAFYTDLLGGKKTA